MKMKNKLIKKDIKNILFMHSIPSILVYIGDNKEGYMSEIVKHKVVCYAQANKSIKLLIELGLIEYNRHSFAKVYYKITKKGKIIYKELKKIYKLLK